MTDDIKEKLKEIKQSFRLMMNGPASQSMRNKGLAYKLNWGVPVTALKVKARDYGKDYDLAIALYKEDVRECKILATMIMPPERMPREVTDVWMEQNDSQEIVEQMVLNVLQYVDYAPALAYEWIANDRQLYKIGGYHLLSRIFMRGDTPDERGINEYLDQADSDLQDADSAVKHAAYNSVLRFCDLGNDYETIATKALAHLGIL
jgi:hypothetical protein